jgi:hypothetical protein
MFLCIWNIFRWRSWKRVPSATTFFHQREGGRYCFFPGVGGLSTRFRWLPNLAVTHGKCKRSPESIGDPGNGFRRPLCFASTVRGVDTAFSSLVVVYPPGFGVVQIWPSHPGSTNAPPRRLETLETTFRTQVRSHNFSWGSVKSSARVSVVGLLMSSSEEFLAQTTTRLVTRRRMNCVDTIIPLFQF